MYLEYDFIINTSGHSKIYLYDNMMACAIGEYRLSFDTVVRRYVAAVYVLVQRKDVSGVRKFDFVIIIIISSSR